jgi:hypothetical protein
MKFSAAQFAMVLSIVVGLWAETAWAFPPSNPYLPSPGEIQSMFDRTGDFSGNAQASTTTKSDIPGGIQLNVNWSTGTPFVNETFTRSVRTQRFPEDNGDGDGGDLQAFDGVAWNIVSDTAIAVKPYSQSWDNFNFQEGNQADVGCGAGVICVPANTPTVVSIDWDMVGTGFPASDRTNIFEVGFQVFGPGLAQDGSTAASVIQITSRIPEPTSLALTLLGGCTVLGFGRRNRK